MEVQKNRGGGQNNLPGVGGTQQGEPQKWDPQVCRSTCEGLDVLDVLVAGVSKTL